MLLKMRVDKLKAASNNLNKFKSKLDQVHENEL